MTDEDREQLALKAPPAPTRPKGVTGWHRVPIFDRWGRRLRVGDRIEAECRVGDEKRTIETILTEPHWPTGELTVDGCVVATEFDSKMGVLRCLTAEVVAFRRQRLTRITLLAAFAADQTVNLEALAAAAAKILEDAGAVVEPPRCDSAEADVREDTRHTDFLANDLWVWHERLQEREVAMMSGHRSDSRVTPPPPGHLWEWAEDKCLLCDAHLGCRLRWMHVGLCDQCAKAPKH